MPLSVGVGLKDPQAFTGTQDQLTPFVSLVMAVMSDMELTCTEVGGAGLKDTVMAEAVMVIRPDADFEESVTEVAKMVTVPPLGIEEGAV
jgi:hypothetical protein